MIGGIDRRGRLHAGNTVLGIDHLTVDPATQTTLDVHFLAEPSAQQQARLTAAQVAITATAGDAAPVPVQGIGFPTVDGEVVLRVTTALPGGFTRYTMTLTDPPGGPLFDPYLAGVDFSFKAGCPTGVDCEHTAHRCDDTPAPDLAVDYQARDFWSMRTTLLDFAAQRYPRWADRLEADAAVMLTEAMAALADELAYQQDRIGREAHLETATQRRSLRRHARLVDYRIHDGLGADTRIVVTAKAPGPVPAGTGLHAFRDGQRIGFSVGRDLDDILAGSAYPVDPARNADRLIPYQWDEQDVCLPVGATSLSLDGGQAVVDALHPFDDEPAGDLPGRWLLLRTEPADPAAPVRARLVRITSAEVVRDPLLGRDTTHVRWAADQALTEALDLASLRVYGNVLPAVAGEHVARTFVIGPGDGSVPAPAALRAAELPAAAGDDPADPPEPPEPAWAVERTGPRGSRALLFSLYRTDTDGLVRRRSAAAPDDPRLAEPELRLTERIPDGAGGFVDGRPWTARHSLLDAPASGPQSRDYVLDDGFWRRIVGYQRVDHEFVHVDHATGAGVTIRFGDGEFGLIPARGTRFRASYLVGNGRPGNLPAGAIRYADGAGALITAVENPFPVDNGVDPETPAEIRQLAPEAFRATTLRAVRPEDYAEAAGRLDWVQRAGCSFRWTGSWLTAFVTPDPRSRVEVTAAERAELTEQLDRFRQAGRETSALDPRYADLDLIIGVCVAADAYAAEVRVQVARVLDAFFDPDRFTFDTALDRSRLEATVQGVAGVRAVRSISFRRRGLFAWRELPAAYRPGLDEVIRVENDPLHPGRGSYRLVTDGGA
ncbi:hypothetical protein [Actinoplanes sp. CA-252034]|uniref:hypothetical protein n=1 Tax=Actinoplanes sp. CA-252034 TaxID=3239906 RepID=UPI003D954484